LQEALQQIADAEVGRRIRISKLIKKDDRKYDAEWRRRAILQRRDELLAGALPRHQKLIETLMEEFWCSRSTVKRALGSRPRP
jgi:hypothetical protein